MASVSSPSFGRLRSFLWPIHRNELKKFIPLFLIYALIVFNYSLLKVAKDTLIITAPSSGAEAIPFIKVWAILPMAILFTYLFTRLFNRHNLEHVFYIMMSVFLGFFLVFAILLYPLRDVIHPHGFADTLQTILPKGFQGLISIVRNWSFTLFYIMSELWGTTVMTVLFWGFVNEITTVKDAKRFYGILGVGANLATTASGLIAILLSKNLFFLPIIPGVDQWGRSLTLITFATVLVGIATMIIFRWYNQRILKRDATHMETNQKMYAKPTGPKMSLRKNFSYLFKSKYLLYIGILVVGFNIAINMVEVVWKDQISMLHPDPNDFNAYMGKVMTSIGVLSTFVGLFFCGSVIRKFGWTISALITPLILLFTGVIFFSFILFKDSGLSNLAILLGSTPLILGVFFGTLQNVLSRACKFTLFDATKEIAFIPLTTESRIKGKAAIDGVGSRLGKSGGSIIHQALLMIFGTVSLSAPYVGIFLLMVVSGWIVAAKSLGKQFTKLTTKEPEAEPLPEGGVAEPEEAQEEVLV